VVLADPEVEVVLQVEFPVPAPLHTSVVVVVMPLVVLLHTVVVVVPVVVVVQVLADP
jgi:hypothetical protein